MTLSWSMWRDNERVQRAERNSPSMKPGEKGQHVHLLQAALILNNIDVPHHGITDPNNPVQNNNYQQETAAAVRTAEQRFSLTSRDNGIAGQQVIQALDNATNSFYLTNAGRFGAARAVSDAPRALEKVEAAVRGLSALRAAMGTPGRSGIPLPNIPTTPGVVSLRVVNDALRDQFRLLAPGIPGPAVARLATTADIDRISVTFFAIGLLLRQAATAFVDGIPVNGVKTAAESPEGSLSVTFGPMFRDFDGPFGDAIGRGSRVAVVIHETMHAVDTSQTSGRLEVHISEFDPAYDTQPADLAMFNPSSYATFAAHVFHGRDRRPRFGLGPGARGLED